MTIAAKLGVPPGHVTCYKALFLQAGWSIYNGAWPGGMAGQSFHNGRVSRGMFSLQGFYPTSQPNTCETHFPKPARGMKLVAATRRAVQTQW